MYLARVRHIKSFKHFAAPCDANSAKFCKDNQNFTASQRDCWCALHHIQLRPNFQDINGSMKKLNAC